MRHILIQTAYFNESNTGLEYLARQRFPETAKGLALAVIAAERMTTETPANSDIRVMFADGQNIGDQLDDAHLFDLIAYHRHHFSILDKCKAIIDRRPAVSTESQTAEANPRAEIERTNKLKIARAAIEDLVDAGLSLSWPNVSRARNVDEIMEAVAAANLAIAFSLVNKRGRDAGYVVFCDGADHEIFASRSINLDEILDRAFGLINEANDYGEISDLAA